MKYFTREALVNGLEDLKNRGVTNTTLYMYRKLSDYYLYLGLLYCSIDEITLDGDDNEFKVIICNNSLATIFNCNMVEIDDEEDINMNMKGKRGINKIMYANEEMNVDACKELALAFISLCELFDISIENYRVIIDGFLATDRNAYTSISDLDFIWTKKEYRKMMDVISKALNDYNSIERRWEDESKTID